MGSNRIMTMICKIIVFFNIILKATRRFIDKRLLELRIKVIGKKNSWWFKPNTSLLVGYS